MNKTLLLVSECLIALCGSIVILNSCGGTISDNPTDSRLTAPKSWFAADSTLSPDNITPFLDSNTPTSAFHLWAWQKFLSITRSTSGIAPFESYVQVDNNMTALGNMIELADSSQAGTNGVLYDTTGRAIYYTIHVNQQMFDFQQQYLPEFAGIYNQYTGQQGRSAKIQKDLHQQGLDTLTYPPGCVELKTAWVLASSLSSTETYYTTTARLQTTSGIHTVKVALIGMHVIGTVKNHPEFIWATFEHDNLVPDYSWAQPGYPSPGDTLSHKNFLFYQQDNVIANCLMNNNACTFAGFNNLFNIYPLGMARSFTGESVTTAKDEENDSEIRSLNKSVKEQLRKKQSLWQHYFYKGSVWLNYPNTSFAPGNGNLGILTNRDLNGARAVSNITMESFAQTNFSGNYTTGSMNCFGCHATVDYKNVLPNTNDSISYNLALSHLFKNALLIKAPPTAEILFPCPCAEETYNTLLPTQR